MQALAKVVHRGSPSSVYLEGCKGSCAPLLLSALSQKLKGAATFLILLDDDERAGYFYHDMVQILGDKDVLLYPSTYRRAVKYAQRDAANEILRTDVLGRLSRWEESEQPQSLFVVSHPDALAERVASQQEMQDNTLIIRRGASHDLTDRKSVV